MMGLRYILPLLLVAVLPLVYGYAIPQSESDEILIDSDEGEDFDDLWQHDHRDHHDHRDRWRKKEFHCPYPYGQYADPYDCAQFYVCKFGVPHSVKCSRNKLYDAKKQSCRDRRDVTCKPKDSREDSSSEEDSNEEKHKGDLECPYIWGTYAHPIDCSKYYVCNYKMPSVFSCRDNELFDDREKKCRDKRRVKCGNRLDRDQMKTSRKPRVTTTTTRKPTTTKPTKTTTKSTKTTTTRKGTTTSRQPTATTVRPETKTTTTSIKTTTEITTTTSKSYFCPFQYGRFADSKDCSRFYNCVFFVPHLNFCPKNTLYDERKEECREAKKVKCNERPRGPNDDYEGDKDEKQENFKCPYIWGTFTHPVDCSKYIVCVYNVPTVFTCRKTELFEPKYRRCISSDKVDCRGRVNPDDSSSTTPSSKTTPSLITTPSPVPTTTTTPIPTTTTTTPIPTTTTTTPIPTTTTTTPIPTTTTTTPIPTTTTTTPIPTTTTTTPIPTTTPTTTTVKPNIPPPTDCDDDDPDCIMEETKEVDKWFKCPERYGHYPHGSSVHLFVHCDNWRPYIKKCAEGTKFHPEYMVCVWVGQ